MNSYGTEQDYSGGNDPANREPLWTSGFSTSSKTYNLIKTSLSARTKASSSSSSVYMNLYSDGNVYAFRRGIALVVVNNFASNSAQAESTVSKTFSVQKQFADGQRLTDSYSGQSVQIATGGIVTVSIVRGAPLVLIAN